MFQKYITSVLGDTDQFAYYFVDLKSKHLAYINDVACDLLKITQDSYQGLSVYDLHFDSKLAHSLEETTQLHSRHFTHTNEKNGPFHQFPHSFSSIISLEDKSYLLVLNLKQGLSKEYQNLFDHKIDFDTSMIDATHEMLNDGDPEVAIHNLLEITNQFFSSSKCSLLGIDSSGSKLIRSYQFLPTWMGENTTTNESPVELFSLWDEHFPDETELFFTHPQIELSHLDTLTQTLKEKEVTSFILAPVRKKGEIEAYLLIENPMVLHVDLRFIRSIVIFFQEGLQKRLLTEQLENVYDYDLLTGLFNQKKYLERLEQISLNLPRQLGIVFVDVQGFGTTITNDAIKNAAAIMESYFQDPFYRVDQEQFVCFVPDINKEDFIQYIDHFQLETCQNSQIHFTIGHSWEEGEDTILWQLQSLEQLMLQGKEEFHQVAEEHADTNPCSVQKDLLSAIESQEFEIYYQPKMSLKDNTVVGAEALVRRQAQHESTLISPGLFVQLYEDQAIIRHLDLYVVEHVCQTQSKWQKEGISIPISVNFSRITLTEFDIVKTICDICDRYEIPHHMLIIEFTERIAMMNEKIYQEIAYGFEKEGFLLSLDDFGAAYSNLITIANIDLDEIKIDRSLIQNLEYDTKNQLILKSIINMCHIIEDTTSLAEGIESETQVNLLREFGCKYGQGNYFSPPITATEFYEKFLAYRS